MHSNVDGASEERNVKLGDADAVGPDGPEAMVVSGADVSAASVVVVSNSRFGEPAASVTVPVVAPPLMTSATVAGDAAGLVCKNSAAAPATCGAAIDVPLIVAVATSDVCQEDVMFEPGANKSTHVPQFENDDRRSPVLVEATVSALAARPGELRQASAFSLPAATV